MESLEKAVRKVQAGEIMKKGGWWEYKAQMTGIPPTLKTESRKLAFPAGNLQPNSIAQPEESYPLQLYVHVPLAFSFGEGAHLPYLHSLAGAHLGEQWETWAEIHPATAGKLGISDGQWVWVESSQGKIRARARHYEGIREDVVSIPFGLGR
ncbi:MAG: molybdopterin dinucleotide binding domain-containing protein, partial [Pseudomonadota bacterium]